MRRLAPLLLALALAGWAARPARAVEFLGAVVNGVGGVEGLSRATYSTSSPDGMFLYVVGRTDDSIGIFERDLVSGALTYLGRATWTGSALPGGTIPDLDRPTAVAVSPDGAFLYATARRAIPGGTLVIFQRNPATGALTFLGSILNGTGGVGGLENTQTLTMSSDGLNLYLPAFDNNAVVALARAPATGAVGPLDIEFDGVAGVDGLEAPHTAAESPDGAHLYVVSQSRPTVTPGLGGLTVFERDAAGALDFVELEQQGAGGVDGLWAPRGVAVSPDGLHVYTANFGRGNEVPPKPGGIAVFARDPADGRLAFVDSYSEGSLGIQGPMSVAVSTDGSEVFLAAQGNNFTFQGSLLVFSRDPASGELTLRRRFDDNVAGVDGLAGAFHIHVPVDGAHLYVSSEQEPLASELRGGVAIFSIPEPPAAAGAAAALLAIGLLAASRRVKDR
jgi:6-phosphogluconolactonase (cycloisomerase 2 family)